MISLLYGDCLDLLKNVPDGSVDMILCDLPYGTTKCKWDVVIPFTLLWEQYTRVIKPNAAILLFGTEPFSSKLRLSNLDWYRYDWYWEKDKGANWMFGNKMPLKTIETVSVFYALQPTYIPQKKVNPEGSQKKHLSKNPAKITQNVRDVMGKAWKETGDSTIHNYSGKTYEPDKLLPRQNVYFPREQRGKVHPTQKPVGLLEYLIRTYTYAGETVLDTCMGSGSTGVACYNSNRKFVGMELDANYYAIAKQRLEVLG